MTLWVILVYLLALDSPSSDSIFALAAHAQFYLWRANSGGKQNKTHPYFFGFTFLNFQTGIYRSMVHPAPFQSMLKRSHLWAPSVDIFPKDLAKWHCFDCMHLFVVTHCCPTLLPFFFHSSSSNLALHSNICVQSVQMESAAISALEEKLFWSNFNVKNTFRTYQAISCVQLELTHTTLLKLVPLQIPSTVSTSSSLLSLLMYELLTAWARSWQSMLAHFFLQQSHENLMDFTSNIKSQAKSFIRATSEYYQIISILFHNTNGVSFYWKKKRESMFSIPLGNYVIENIKTEKTSPVPPGQNLWLVC